MRLLISVLALSLAGCAGVGVVSRPYLDNASWSQDTNGAPTNVRTARAARYVTYKLPVTVVDLSATYEVRACLTDPAHPTVATPDESIALVNVAIESFVRSDPDPHHWFDVDADDWSGFAVALAEAKLEINADQMLTSVNYRSQPQFSQTVAALTRLANIGSGSVLLSNASYPLLPCTPATTRSLARRTQHKALVKALDDQLATLDEQIAAAGGATQANARRRQSIIEMRNAALLRILDIRDNELRFTVRYRWMPAINEFQRTLPTDTDRVDALGGSPFDLAAADDAAQPRLRTAQLLQLRTLLTFSLQLRPETQLGRAGGPAVPALEADCQLLSLQAEHGGGPGSSQVAESSVTAVQFTGVYHRTPVRVRPILIRAGGTCREIGWNANAPLNLSVLQYGPLQRIPIEGSMLFARSRGATFVNGSLTSITAGANDASGPALLNAAGDVADAQRQVALGNVTRDTAELNALTALAKAREAYNETNAPTTPPPTTTTSP